MRNVSVIMYRDSEHACLLRYLQSDFCFTLYLLRLNGVFHIKFSNFLLLLLTRAFAVECDMKIVRCEWREPGNLSMFSLTLARNINVYVACYDAG